MTAVGVREFSLALIEIVDLIRSCFDLMTDGVLTPASRLYEVLKSLLVVTSCSLPCHEGTA